MVIYQWFDDYGGLHFLLNLNCQQEDEKDIIKGKMPPFIKIFQRLGFYYYMQYSLVGGMTTLDIKERYYSLLHVRS